ncbi:PP2C family protein-serine/threonine phosphatase [Frankia sp. Cr2]|uniref:PP2C family protein-serine/threonine phosphatase n=1 Tax=Frankia sp. Cr2 TaxID=3073932 RepID=UPI002AD50163|nr:PP2C family protein-serine/threonine phosphatase [Frankia sp. Cr2]
MEGLELTWRYQPSTVSTEADGDWFDVIVLPTGRIALVIGDVMGRGLGAATETVTLANAGHLPPALRHPDGTVELIGDTHGIMLGVGDQKLTKTRCRFPAGSTLALYTDGLVESPTVGIGDGCQRLLDTLADTVDLPTIANLPTTANRLLRLIDRGNGFDDDVALLLARANPCSHGS